MATLPLPLSILCDVTVSVTAQGVATPTFNQGLIVGDSGVIPSLGASSRVREYATLAAMISDGFTPSDPEYIAAGLYFGQTPPAQFLWVGCQDPSAIQTAAITTGGHAGTGWVVGEQFSIAHAGAQGGIGQVLTVTGGAVATFKIIAQGTGYVVSTANTTTSLTGAGTGLEIDITAIGETALQAVMACRVAQPAWYCAMVCGSDDDDALAIAEYAQTAVPQMQYLYGTSSADVLSGASGNIFSEIKAANYSRAHGAYSTTQGGAAPNNIYIAAAVMGVAMGLNSGLAGSAFTLDAKTLVGIITEPLTLSQINVMAGTPGQSTGNNGNVFVNFANSYDFYIQGVNGNGTWFDQIIGLDMLAADCQISVLNVLASMASIPQTNAGQMLILNAVNGACARSATRGFLAGGVWSGPAVLGLTPGSALPTGYLAQSPSYATQSSGNRALRQSMPVYISVILAGSQQSFTIAINVQA